MPDFPHDSTIRIPLLARAGGSESTRRPSLEEEVVALFDQFRNRLLRYLISLGLSPQDGEEVIQDVFLALFRHLSDGKSRDNLRGWLFRVAHNLGLKRRQPNREIAFAQTEELAEQRPDPGPNPEEQAAARQRQKRLLAVVRALPEQDRACLHLRAEGLRYREIAEVLGISLGGVALSLERSLARLARAGER